MYHNFFFLDVDVDVVICEDQYTTFNDIRIQQIKYYIILTYNSKKRLATKGQISATT
jgi:hypothetical protein